MKTLIKLKFVFLILFSSSLTLAQVDWRFGFEDTWAHLIGYMTTEQKETLLTKLEIIVESQQTGGDINFPAISSGWKGLQLSSGAPIDFTQTDKVIQLLQKYGFSKLWNLRINAPWASVNNPDCYYIGDCAPDSDHEDDLYNFIYALVERYDGDGFQDMGYDTPNDASDDLIIPVQRYLMTGEIEFIGASPPPSVGGYGDEAIMHFWTDSIENLLRTHRIVYQAIHDADPTGNTKLVSSGGIFWDLYSDFPDWPQIDGPIVQARLNGQNNHNVPYIQSYNRLKQMLLSFGDDSDGIECDYIGWHPHMPWREIDQTFTFIKTYAGDKPIYIDDMWCNILLINDPPGNTLFTGGGKVIEGDFPNSLVPSYAVLINGMLFNNQPIRDWYYARHARTIVKAFASVFGEGAERASISGIADFLTDKLGIMGTLNENFYEKPGYYTYKLLVEKLHDFTTATEIYVSNDPRTRVYEFDRQGRGPVYVLWSETGEAPQNLDYRKPTGETVTLKVKNGVEQLTLTHIITDAVNTEPDVEMIFTDNDTLTIQLGYQPIFLEGDYFVNVKSPLLSSIPLSFELAQNYPNPFNPLTTINYTLPEEAQVKITIYNLLGEEINQLLSSVRPSGKHSVQWNGVDGDGNFVSAGVYIYQLQAGDYVQTKKMLLMK
ncbi:T9SS type A sorting domain-containing protein [bacterium]|nr:T9SS type A sorting domain-containing protein [bacterium]